MIINDDKKIEIKGNKVEVFIDLLQIFQEFNGRLELKLTDKTPEWLQKYIADFNNCIKQSPKVLKTLIGEVEHLRNDYNFYKRNISVENEN